MASGHHHSVETVGKYKILGVLGKGGMGIVYKGLDPDIEREVAIKTIRLDSYIDGPEKEDLLSRVMREAKAAGRLNHPNIITIYDVIRDSDLTFIVMQFVDGPSLQSLIDAGKAFSPEEVVALLKPVAEALDVAHEGGIVHRDIKPANILIDRTGKPFLADFGVARLETSTMTGPGTTVGTISYMSPEQVMGKTVDGRADFFALGVILYELLTGKKPFAGDNLSTIVYRIVHEEPPRLTDLKKDLPPGYENVICRALAKAPEERYQSGREMIADLENPDRIAAATRAFKLKTGAGPEEGRRRKRPYALGIGLLLCAAAAAAVILLAPGGTKPGSTAAPLKATQAPSAGPPSEDSVSADKGSPSPEILARLKDSFDGKNYEDAIRLAEGVLNVYPGNAEARDYLNRAKERQLAGRIAALMQAGVAGFESGQFAACVQSMEEVLRLDRTHKGAQDYLVRADHALSRKDILALIEGRRGAEERMDMNALLGDLGPAGLRAKQQDHYAMLFNIYERIETTLEAGEAEILFSGRSQATASFDVEIRGRSRKDGQWETILVARRTWDLEKRGTAWKIVDIRDQL